MNPQEKHSWEKEFDEKFIGDGRDVFAKRAPVLVDDIRTFIRSQREQAAREEREHLYDRIVAIPAKMIEEMQYISARKVYDILFGPRPKV